MRESCTYGVVRGRSVMSVPTAIIIILGEAHLRRILKSYARYYNETRTHLALGKDAPVSRPVQRTGVIGSCDPGRTSSPLTAPLAAAGVRGIFKNLTERVSVLATPWTL
jgi:hypothetical protein